MDRKVSTAYLKVGMYVTKLDRPWLQTPFLIQGFIIKEETEICELVKYCDHVYIDVDLGIRAEMYLDNSRGPGSHSKQCLATNKRVEGILNVAERKMEYIDTKTTVDELPEAKSALKHASECVARIVEHDLKKGQLNIETIKSAIKPILDSMVRNVDAFIWLSKMQQHDNDSYEHSVQNCALGIALGRHMGLNTMELNTLATGLLLMDVGKIKIPKELLIKDSPLTPAETDIMRKHVAFTVEILRKTKDLNEHVINIALTHHERYDGSGYPNGLVGVQTPVYGRMAAIIDCYDAMITTTGFRQGIPEHKALQNIYNSRNKSFQQELVEQFMQCMGVYPTGSLVELSSGAVGAILSQNAVQKLKPKVILLLDENKQPYKKRQVFDLTTQNKTPLHITKSLENNSYGVNVHQIAL